MVWEILRKKAAGRAFGEKRQIQLSLKMSKKDSSSVSVGVRIRPRNEKEIAAGMPVYFTPSADGGAVQELDENGTVLKNWAYDNSFGLDCTNKDIFDTMVMKLVDAAMEGYNTVVFMYGQTSSGKRADPPLLSRGMIRTNTHGLTRQNLHSIWWR